MASKPVVLLLAVLAMPMAYAGDLQQLPTTEAGFSEKIRALIKPGDNLETALRLLEANRFECMEFDNRYPVVHCSRTDLPAGGAHWLHQVLIEPDTVYVIPIKSDSEHYVPDGKLRVYRSKTGGNEWEPLTRGLPQEHCYVNVLRDAMAVDSLDQCGVYFGTTGGQVYVSPDGGDTWSAIVRDLPAVLSVEVQTLS